MYPLLEVRDGSNAVALAEKAVAQTGRMNAAFQQTLTAACAETGDFAKAVSIEKEAEARPEVQRINRMLGSARLTEARDILEKGRRIVETELPGPLTRTNGRSIRISS
jgi:hypothetical protein